MITSMPEPSIAVRPLQDKHDQQHPRRPPADKSVSLLHSSRSHRLRSTHPQSDSSSNDSRQARTRIAIDRKQDDGSPSSLAPQAGKQSSGESSNAEKWFDESNNEVQKPSNPYANNDSPFFLRNASSSEDQIDVAMSAQQYSKDGPTGPPLTMQTDVPHLGTDKSSTEDYRGVIDDLTVENKKLKRRLKKYEKLHDIHLQDEKLFEVRIHGLPADKKRDLEDTLRKFATDLHGPRQGAEFPASGYGGLGLLQRTHKPALSSTSLQHTDSAYASMSASGRGSSASDTRNRPFAQSAKSRHQNIHTYLHHIPEGLLPNSNPGATMSERSKKKMVVRRLEQIFAGKGAAASGHQQALQQQDVSQMAARADRTASEADGHRSGHEGIREANIMRKSAEEIAAAQASAPDATTLADKSNLEQRPTRPLDLDPHRAQVPADNLRYIRHLGFTLPDSGGRSPEDDEGWVYLNLLINMAQLHIINVTYDFVRKAVDEFSVKLEVSSDGRKLRWKGGRSVTKTSSYGGDSIRERTDDDSSQSPRKRFKSSHMTSDRGSSRALRKQEAVSSARSHENSRFAYTPLFLHKESAGDGDSSSDMDDDDAGTSSFQQVIGGDSSGVTSSGIRTTSINKNKKKQDDGPIIFYNNARFCTDLSGEQKPANGRGGPAYKAFNVSPVGKPDTPTRTHTKYYEKRGPLAGAVNLPEPMDLADNPISDTLELAFSPKCLAEPLEEQHDQPLVNFEVSGIGGVYPADNFSIAVERTYAVVDASHEVATQSKVVPPKLTHILGGGRSARNAYPAQLKQTISARRKELRPSALPPASSYMQNDSTSDDGSDADEDSISISADSIGAMSRVAAPQQMDLPFSMNDDSGAEMDYTEDEDGDEDEDDSDDDSLDLLAAAREIDPEAVRAREREYDANMAERLAEEIPTGSSAATAGGGSGFVSPASGITPAAYVKAKNAARSHRVLLSRAQTSDSTITGDRSEMSGRLDSISS